MVTSTQHTFTWSDISKTPSVSASETGDKPLIDFIVKYTPGWVYPYLQGNPVESLKQALERLGNPGEATAWAARHLHRPRSPARFGTRLGHRGAAEMVLAEMAKLGTLNTQSNRNLQRLLVDYRKLQERSLD